MNRLLLIVLLVCGMGSSALADPPPSYGLDFVTVGAPGNRATLPEETPMMTGFRPMGAVAYEFRITRTEISVGRWFEFVRAYAPYYTGSPFTHEFTSDWINWNGSEYVLAPGAEGMGANVGWRYAARYCNWLHNGKRPEQEAFESGAYDTSTFVTLPGGTFGDQERRSPGAKFWIPDIDEHIKATRYDAGRYGAGLGGYWTYGHGSELPPIPGWPASGGQTSAGIYPPPPNFMYPALGSYPGVESPWGLLEVSGGEREWTETASADFTSRFVMGTRAFSTFPELQDRIDFLSGGSPPRFSNGFRVASVPAPQSLLVVLLAPVALWRRR